MVKKKAGAFRYMRKPPKYIYIYLYYIIYLYLFILYYLYIYYLSINIYLSINKSHKEKGNKLSIH